MLRLGLNEPANGTCPRGAMNASDAKKGFFTAIGRFAGVAGGPLGDSRQQRKAAGHRA
jgi:hypothetical protein